MASYTMTIATSCKVLGGSPSSRYEKAVFDVDYYDEGSDPLIKNFTKSPFSYIMNLGDTWGVCLQFFSSISNQISISDQTIDRYLLDKTFFYVWPGGNIDADYEVFSSYTIGVDTTASYTSDIITAPTYTKTSYTAASYIETAYTSTVWS